MDLRSEPAVEAYLPALPPKLLAPVLQVAMEICGDCDMDATFELGLKLMLNGLEAR